MILDPNQYASQLYQKGIMAGVERRSKERKAKGINSSDLITVTLSNTEADLKEDLEWGALTNETERCFAAWRLGSSVHLMRTRSPMF